MKNFTPSSEKICIICGQSFMPKSRAQRICDREHTHPCPMCGKPVKIQYKSDFKKCCSVECSSKLRRMTNLQRYGVDNPSKSDEIRSKVVETCLRRYGAASPLQVPRFRAESSHKSKEDKVETSVQKVTNCGVISDKSYEDIVKNFLLSLFPSVQEHIDLEFIHNGVRMCKTVSFCAGDTYVDCMLASSLNDIDKQEYAEDLYRMYSNHNVLVVTDVNGSVDINDVQRFKYIGHHDMILHGADIQIFQKNRSDLLVEWPSFNLYLPHLSEDKLHQYLENTDTVWSSLLYWTSVEGGFVTLGSVVQSLLSPKSPTYILKDLEDS